MALKMLNREGNSLVAAWREELKDILALVQVQLDFEDFEVFELLVVRRQRGGTSEWQVHQAHCSHR